MPKRTTQAANKTWNAFWSRFSTAVKNKNRAAVKAMASSRFTWHEAYDDSVSAWIQNLDKNKLRHLVQNSVKKGTVSYDAGEKKPWRVTSDNHCFLCLKTVNGGFMEGRPPTLSIEDKVLLTFEYWREYRTQFHIANSW